MLNAKDLATYTAAQVASLVDIDAYAVRDEGYRRQSAVEKKIARLAKQIEAAKRELMESQGVILAALRELEKEAA